MMITNVDPRLGANSGIMDGLLGGISAAMGKVQVQGIHGDLRKNVFLHSFDLGKTNKFDVYVLNEFRKSSELQDIVNKELKGTIVNPNGTGYETSVNLDAQVELERATKLLSITGSLFTNVVSDDFLSPNWDYEFVAGGMQGKEWKNVGEIKPERGEEVTDEAMKELFLDTVTAAEGDVNKVWFPFIEKTPGKSHYIECEGRYFSNRSDLHIRFKETIDENKQEVMFVCELHLYHTHKRDVNFQWDIRTDKRDPDSLGEKIKYDLEDRRLGPDARGLVEIKICDVTSQRAEEIQRSNVLGPKDDHDKPMARRILEILNTSNTTKFQLGHQKMNWGLVEKTPYDP